MESASQAMLQVAIDENAPDRRITSCVHTSIDLPLVAWTVLNALRLELLPDLIGETTLDGDRIPPRTYLSTLAHQKFHTSWTYFPKNALYYATQLFSGSMTAMHPSKCVVVQV